MSNLPYTEPWSSNDDARIDAVWAMRRAQEHQRNAQRLAAWRRKWTRRALDRANQFNLGETK